MKSSTFKPSRWLATLLVVALIGGGISISPETALAQGTPGPVLTCIDDVVGDQAPNNCTADDVKLGLLIVDNPTQVVCEWNEDLELFTAEVKMQAQLVANATKRYDIGMYIAEDGGNARTGACHRNYLPAEPFPLADLGSYAPLSGVGPYYDAEGVPGDLCGDIEKDQETLYNLLQLGRCDNLLGNDSGSEMACITNTECPDDEYCFNEYGDPSDGTPIQVPADSGIYVEDTILLVCEDLVDENGAPGQDGFVDVASCVSWDNDTKLPVCASVFDAKPNNKAKCRCERSPTNVPMPAFLTLVKNVVNDSGGDEHASAWTLSATGSGSGLMDFSEAGTPATGTTATVGPKVVDPTAVYTLAESGPSGYDNGSGGAPKFSCVFDVGSGTFDSGAQTIDLDPGAAATCTITNDDIAPTLKLVKTVTNDHGGTKVVDDWTLTADGTGANDWAGNTTWWGVSGKSVKADTYALSETNITGYLAGSWNCTGTGSQSGSSITLALAQTATCTINNDDIAPQLTVIKNVTNDHGGTAVPGDFTMQVTGTEVSSPSFPGVTGTGTTVTLDAGSYSVDENMNAWTGKYTKSLGANCSGSISIGESKTCTITNDDIAPQLTVIKNVTNDHGGTAVPGDFTMQVTGTEVSSPSFPGVTGTGTTVTLDAGAYSVDENMNAWTGKYTRNLGANCSGSIAIGESKTCTITNDDIAPTLTLVKSVMNGSDPGGTAVADDWTLTADGTGANDWAGNTTWWTGGKSVKADTYDLSESAHSGYTDSDWVCTGTGNAVDGDTIQLDLAETATCTITNTALGRVDVYKLVNGVAATSTFTFHLFGDDVDETDSTVPALVDFGQPWLIPGDTYAVCESNIPVAMTSVWAVDANGNGIMDPGESQMPFVGDSNDTHWQVYNPEWPVDTGMRCVDFTVNTGHHLHLVVNNATPLGDARTPGYWSNWSSCTNGNQFAKATAEFNDGIVDGRHYTLDEILPQLIGDLYLDGDPDGNVYDGDTISEADCLAAVYVLQSREQNGRHKKQSSDAAYKLARSLLAYRANQAAGAYICPIAANAAVAAQDLLGSAEGVGYNGNGSFLSPKGKVSEEMAEDIATALELHGILDAYNNNDLTSCDP